MELSIAHPKITVTVHLFTSNYGDSAFIHFDLKLRFDWRN